MHLRVKLDCRTAEPDGTAELLKSLNPNGGTPGTQVDCRDKRTDLFGEMMRVGVMRWGDGGPRVPTQGLVLGCGRITAGTSPVRECGLVV